MILGNNMQQYSGFHGDTSTPSPHASPSYPNVPGQQYFRFGSSGGGVESQQPGGDGSAPQFMFAGSRSVGFLEATILLIDLAYTSIINKKVKNEMNNVIFILS